MSRSELYDRNLLAVTTTHGPTAAERLSAVEADPRVGTEPSRYGVEVPYLEADGKRAYFHSRFDPEREAARQAAGHAQPGFFVFWGLGAGYVVEALLDAGLVTRGLVVEYGAPALKAVLERMDLTHVLADRRLLLLVDPTDEELGTAIASLYVPVVTGDLVTVPLRGRVDTAPDEYLRAADVVRRVLEGISDDYSVQAFFGKRWFTNIVRNVRAAAAPTPPVGPVSSAIVTAAGPSLEDALPAIRDRPRSSFVIATDTSLQVLLAAGIEPDAVITIDCQHISYYHFMRGMPGGVPLFMDLASPPTVARLARRPYFFSSGHPLSRYVANRFRAFPSLDTSGGNVTHAAVSLADYLGARDIVLYGADFSYPFGKSYARGTYVYPYFDVRQSRLRPQESLFSEFLYRNQYLERQADPDGSYRYVTKPLVAYRDRLERLAASCEARVDRRRGSGVHATMVAGDRPPAGRFGRVFSAGRSFMPASDFLRGYLDDIAALPEPEPGRSAPYLDGLTPRERDVWTTMLPSAAALLKEAGASPTLAQDVLAATRRWCMGVLRTELEADESYPG